MSIDNFIPTIWSANFLTSFQKASVFTGPAIINRNYEGEIAQKGDRVKINQIADPTISDYTKNSSTLTFETLEDAAMFLEINQAKAFAFEIDDVDMAQGSVGVMQLAMNRAAYKMKDTVDAYLAGLYTQAGVTANLGTTAVPLSITAAATTGGNVGVIDFFSKVTEELDKVNCPTDGRFAIIPPAIHSKLILASVIQLYTTQQDVLTNGRVGRTLGFDIFVSNNLTNTAGAKYKCMFGTNSAITYAEQINKIEALRPQAKFSDAVKALMLYGAKVVQADALACATLSTAAG